MKVSFKIDYQTLPGQHVYISGNIEEVGMWKPGKAHKMREVSEGEWEAELELDSLDSLRYKYFVRDRSGRIIWEWGANRLISLNGRKFNEIRLRDFWHSSNDVENVLLSSAFTSVLMRREREKVEKVQERTGMVLRFQVQVPRISPDYTLCITGDQDVLGNWDEKKAVVMSDEDFPLWIVEVDASEIKFPIQFKYAIYDKKERKIVTWEEGNNRVIRDYVCTSAESIKVHTDQKFRYPVGHWKGTGLSVPLASLKTEESRGIGEFNDIKKLVDWCRKAGMKMIQLLPVNESETKNSGIDTYPFKEISSMALHPVYLNVGSIGLNNDDKSMKDFHSEIEKINNKNVVCFDDVYKIKLKYLRRVFDSNDEMILKDPGFIDFTALNIEWLLPYGAFCIFREKYGTSDFRKWEENSTYDPGEIEKKCSPQGDLYDQSVFYYFLQYNLHKQLLDASSYARENRVVLKCAIPVGISRNSVDMWASPTIFKTDQQMGIYPDEFTGEGENLKIPAYNWEGMAANGYSWWKKRMNRMSTYFDAYRIDNIAGLVRSWEIPSDHVQDVMGHFSPALPLTWDEISNYDILLDEERFTIPYIRDYFLWDLFGEYTEEVKAKFLTEYALREYTLKPEFDTQEKICRHYCRLEEGKELSAKDIQICDGLLSLVSEVIFLKDSYDRKKLHPRVFFTDTESFINLEEETRYNLDQLYIDYFFKRHEDFWCEEALKRMPEIIYSTWMLPCGDDLGIIPGCVPGILKEHGILSLEVQRMSKDPDVEFGHLADAPYLSVCSTSTYGMDSLKEWWEEDRERSERFYKTVLGHQTEMPEKLESRILREIINQHLWSNSMWSVFPLYDLIMLENNLPWNGENISSAHESGINYHELRLGFKLEELLNEEAFNNTLYGLISSSGRNADY